MTALINQIIKGKSLNEVTHKAIKSVLSDGVKSDSRNGEVTYLNNVIIEISNPMDRHLNLEGRNNNIYATIAELFWIMSGRDTIDPFLSFFLPRAKDYSDDGETWRGGYGPRLYMDDQLQNAIEVFKTDGLDTRRSIISIYDSGLDSGVSSKDIPCNNLIHFFVVDNKLSMNVVSRSSDAIWGLFGINIPEWTFLQEYVAQQVGVELGTYTHFTTNLHIYELTGGQALNIESSEQSYGELSNNRPCIFPKEYVRSFFQALVDVYSRELTEYSSAYYLECSIDRIFDQYSVTTKHNTLYNYAMMICYYISSKNGDASVGFNAHEFNQELFSCIEGSKFTNFI